MQGIQICNHDTTRIPRLETRYKGTGKPLIQTYRVSVISPWVSKTLVDDFWVRDLCEFSQKRVCFVTVPLFFCLLATFRSLLQVSDGHLTLWKKEFEPGSWRGLRRMSGTEGAVRAWHLP